MPGERSDMCQSKEITVYQSWLTVVISALDKRRQEALQFDGSLGYLSGKCLRTQGLGM